MSSNFERAMKQRGLRNRLASEYSKKHNVDYDYAYKAITQVMNKYGNPYIRVNEGSGRPYYSKAGSEYTNVPKHYYHQQGINRYEKPGYEGGKDWVMHPTMDPDTLDIFEDDFLNDWFAEMGHAMQYRHPGLPFNDPHSAWVRDSLKTEGRLQKDYYGDTGEDKGHGKKGTYGIEHQDIRPADKRKFIHTSLTQKIPLSQAVYNYNQFLESEGHQDSSLEWDAHEEKEIILGNEIKAIIDSLVKRN